MSRLSGKEGGLNIFSVQKKRGKDFCMKKGGGEFFSAEKRVRGLFFEKKAGSRVSFIG